MDILQPTRRALLQLVAGVPAVTSAVPGRSAPDASFPSSAELGLAPGLIHLNTASAGPTPGRVLHTVLEAWRRIETDPVVMSYARDPDTVVTAADFVRGKAAELVGCSADEIMLTQGTTAGITTIAHSIRLREGDHVLLTNQEHEGGETAWLHRQRLDGILVDRVDIPIGEFDASAILRRFQSAVGPRTRAICVSHILSPTGLRMPIAEIAALARQRGALCIVDGAQAVGQVAVDVKALGCDAYATSGHKWLMGPKGTGFIYVGAHAADSIAPPQWLGGKRYGSNSEGLSPMVLAIGLGEAIDGMLAAGIGRVEKHNNALAERIYAGFASIPQLALVSPPPGPLATALVAARLPDAVESGALRLRMRARHRISIKMAEKRWFNGIRFSPHIFNDERQVDIALAALRSELSG